MVKILNFSHPLSRLAINQLTATYKKRGGIDQILLQTQYDLNKSLVAQVEAQINAIDGVEWHADNIVVIPPALSFAAVAVYAVLLGKCGQLPPLVQLRQVPGVTPPLWEVAEVIALNGLAIKAAK